MERITFLIEPGEKPISCMLNPESVVIRFQSSLVQQNGYGTMLTKTGWETQKYIQAVRGVVAIDLELLFDVTLFDIAVSTGNVQDLTRPFYEITEPVKNVSGIKRCHSVRMIWGKCWNVSGIITAITEKLEKFTAEGVAQRSWLSLRLVKTGEEESPPAVRPVSIRQTLSSSNIDIIEQKKNNVAIVKKCETLEFNDRLDNISQKVYGTPELWKVIASFNNLDSLIPDGSVRMIKIPPKEELVGDNI